MKNNNAPLNESEFKKAWEDLEDEYEQEIQRLRAEIEQEETNTAETQKSQSEK